eukprot:3335124-Rhodomonas_salina.1
MHEVLSLSCLRAVHHAMPEVVCVFPAEGTDGIWVALVPVIVSDYCGCGEAEAPGLKEVLYSLFQQCLVLKYVAEHFTAVSERECEVRAPGIQVGAEVFGLDGAKLAAGVSLHSGGTFGFVEEREAGGETGVEGNGRGVNVPFSVLTLCTCFGFKVCLFVARVSCVGLDPHYQGLGSRAPAGVEGVDGC